MANYILTNELSHHGILGMKWGVRRYQNKDGSLTAAGKKRAEKRQAKIDAEDLAYFKKNVTKVDTGSARAKKIAGKQIEDCGKAWTEYFVASNGGKISNKTTEALRKKYDKANLDMMNALMSDVKVPSGRTPKYIVDESGKRTVIFE